MVQKKGEATMWTPVDDAGLTMVGRDTEDHQWFFRCVPCGQLEAYGSKENAISRAHEHLRRADAHAKKPESGIVERRGLAISAMNDGAQTERELNAIGLTNGAPIVDLVRASDVALQNECNARHLSVKRDEQLKEGIDAKLRKANREMATERDEWRRRAEAAERCTKTPPSDGDASLFSKLATYEHRRTTESPDHEGMSPAYWKSVADDYQKRYELAKAELTSESRRVDDWKATAERAEDGLRRVVDGLKAHGWSLTALAVYDFDIEGAMLSLGWAPPDTEKAGTWRARIDAAVAEVVEEREAARKETSEWKASSERRKETIEELLRRAETAEKAARHAPLNEHMRSVKESGAGIAATRPDNSIAHLDEDLLCEDV